MSNIKIKLTDIARPKFYVRQKLDQKRIDDFVHLAGGYAPDQDPAHPKAAGWPFPPIVVNKIHPVAGKALATEKEKAKTSKGKKTKAAVLKPYELIDGHHRVEAARRLGLKEIEAEAKDVKDPAEAYMMQYRANAIGPLQFNSLARAEAIWTMHNVFKIVQANIVKETGMHKASISRICARKQGWGDFSKRANVSKKTAGSQASLFTPEQLFDRFETMCGRDGYLKIKAAFLELCINGVEFKRLAKLRDELGDVFDALDALVTKAIDKRNKPPTMSTSPVASASGVPA